MVEMHQEYVGDIEVIHAVPAGGYALRLPTLFFYHGYTSSKEVYSYFGYALAGAGRVPCDPAGCSYAWCPF